MKFSEVVTQTIAWLQREERVSYRALKREFELEDDFLEDLKEELITVKELAVDKDGKMLVWTGGEGNGESGESENRRHRSPHSSPQPLTPNPHLLTRLRISPSASARNKRRWKRGEYRR